MNIYVAIGAMIILLLLKGLFSGSEIALVNADKIRLKRMAKNGHKGARLVLKAFERPDELLSTTLIGTNISTIALTTIGTLLMVQLLGTKGDFWAFILFTPIFLIMGEIVPKSIFQEKSDELTPILIYPLLIVSKILWPVIFVFSRIAGFVARLAGGSADQGLFVSREQLATVVQLAEQSGSLGTLNEGQLRRVLQFSETTAENIMIRLDELLAFDIASPTRVVLEHALETGHRRFPVYDSKKVNLSHIAIVTNHALLNPDVAEKPLSTLAHPALFVTAATTLDEVLPLILDRQDRMAVVTDDTDSVIGLLTFEDLIASAVGDINVGR